MLQNLKIRGVLFISLILFILLINTVVADSYIIKLVDPHHQDLLYDVYNNSGFVDTIGINESIIIYDNNSYSFIPNLVYRDYYNPSNLLNYISGYSGLLILLSIFILIYVGFGRKK